MTRFSRTVAVLFLMLATSATPQERRLAIAPDDLAAFVDGMFDIQLKRDDAAGAVFLFMQNDATLLGRGYGWANISKHIPMDPDRTIVRGGALAMPVIAVAVMQQVEQGRLSLDEDIARYLDFHLPGRQGGPITLRHLLTHTAGFTDTLSHIQATDLRTYLTRNLPPRTYPAGALNSYSPYGMDLAAYIVERASTEPFSDYAQRHIFAPLGMTRTTLAQPLPTPLAPDLSQGYGASTQGALPNERLELALSLFTSAEDMGRFGAMFLHHGTLDGQHILAAPSVAIILSRQTTTAPDLSPEIPGMGLAFHEIWFNGSRFFGQSGDTAAFHTELEVDPKRHIVLFLAYNSSGHPERAGELSRLATFSRGELIHGIFDRYQPFHPTVVNSTPSADQQRLATGTWVPANDSALPHNASRAIHTKYDAQNQSLLVDRFISDRGTVKRWRMLSPNLWQQYPQDRISAIHGRNGLPDRLALASDPANQLVRVSTRRTDSFGPATYCAQSH
ncbi:MAG: beta-lactamase family protein [Acidobacteriota bacterium]|nr:beta-lactamase family protein [Acidobacteriota bacterium]